MARSSQVAFLLFLASLSSWNSPCLGENKYSKEANTVDRVKFLEDPQINMRTIHKPFRMAKLNLLWTKAQVRLTEPKLKSLYSELKLHDKEELTWKKLKAEGKDKDGLIEAKLRSKLVGIMSTYDLLEHFPDVTDPSKHKPHEPLSGKVADKSHMNRSLFKDKKLNKLWEKAEASGFTAEELKVLKEEFTHHQEKVDHYYSLLKDVEKGDQDNHWNTLDESHDKFNEINRMEVDEKMSKKEYLSKLNALKEKQREVRDDYDRLYRLSASGPANSDFVEPKVQGLWKLAASANFSADELESLKSELLHYEKRLLKLRHLQVSAVMDDEAKKGKSDNEKPSLGDITEDVIKKHARKVAKIHTDIESRILERHSEL